jgi:uncharacterized protein
MGVNAASFDCKKAKSKVEKSICGDSELSQLDEQLAEAYKKNIATHPLPSYVKARQRDWLKLNPYCDPKNFKICLKKNYKERLIYLQNLNPVVYSNSKQFSYDNGDAVAEFMQVGPSQWRLSIWGGFSFHNQAQAFVGCEFEGNVSAIADGLATSIDGSSVKYQIQGNEFVLDPAAEICAGFGRMPENMLKINP